MKIFHVLLLVVTLIGCANCSQGGNEPYVRTQPGVEYCDDMCNVLKDKDCKGYYEDIIINCNDDPIYFKTMNCDINGVVILTCTQFCEYEMRNSVQLNPKCIADNLVTCDEIEDICK